MGPLVILGAGGHAKVVASAARAAGFQVLGFRDDNPQSHGQCVFGLPILGGIKEFLGQPDAPAVIGIGKNSIRQRLSTGEVDWKTVVHPAAWVDPSVALGAGTVVFAGAVINPDCRVGSHVVVNTGCSIDHDCVVGDFAQVAPGARLAGNVTVGPGVFVGLGAVVRQGVTIGEWSVIGAAAAVVRSLPPHVLAMGVPARLARTLDPGESPL